MEGFLRYWFGVLIHGGTYFRNFTVTGQLRAVRLNFMISTISQHYFCLLKTEKSAQGINITARNINAKKRGKERKRKAENKIPLQNQTEIILHFAIDGITM